VVTGYRNEYRICNVEREFLMFQDFACEYFNVESCERNDEEFLKKCAKIFLESFFEDDSAYDIYEGDIQEYLNDDQCHILAEIKKEL
jgi:hypothetical protein